MPIKKSAYSSFLASSVTTFDRSHLVAVLSGGLASVSSIFYGLLMDELNVDSVEVSSVVKIIASYFSLLLLPAIFAFCERACLGYFSEQITRHYRDNYVAALLSHDVEYIESFSPGKLGQRFSEESSTIVEGLGPGLGSLMRALSSLFCGILIGVNYVFVLPCIHA